MTTSATPSSELSAEVAVVGAGISGLSCARRLGELGIDDVVVIEAKDRVGGRLLDEPLGPGSGMVELGGQWSGYDHQGLRDLAAAVGVEQYEPYGDGDALFDGGDEFVRYRGAIPPLSTRGAEAMSNGGARIDELAAAVPADAPWLATDAVALDRRTLADWLDEVFPAPDARRAMEIRMSLGFAIPTERISLLHTGAFFAGVGGWGPYQGRLALRASGGAAAVPKAIAASLGERVHLGTPVRAIDQTQDREVHVTCDVLSVQARHVVVALGPADCRTIVFTPALPPARAMLHHVWQAGAQIKAYAVYEEPFWRRADLSGSSWSLSTPPYMTFDNTPDHGSAGVLGSLLTIGAGPEQVAGDRVTLTDPDARRAQVLEVLTTRFGPEASAPVRYFEKCWLSEPFTAGCVAPTPPRLWTTAGSAIRAPVDRVHWASTETAARWTGWMEGAVLAGQRAAQEIVDGG